MAHLRQHVVADAVDVVKLGQRGAQADLRMAPDHAFLSKLDDQAHQLAEALRGVLFIGHAQHGRGPVRSEEHTSELQSLMRISYAVFCLKNKKNTIINYISST